MQDALRAASLTALLLSGCTAPSTPTAASSANAAVEPRYLALGDSFTAGTGSSPEQSFPARLVAYWSTPSVEMRAACAVTLLNLGVNGYMTDDVIDEELPRLAPFAPQLVTLAIGANDIVHDEKPSVYEAHVHQILATVVAAGVKRIVAIPQPDWSQSPAAARFGSPAAIHASIVAFNAILQKETLAVGGEYIDLFPLMEQQASAHMVADDRLHPSSTAYDAWGAALAKRVAAPCGSAATK